MRTCLPHLPSWVGARGQRLADLGHGGGLQRLRGLLRQPAPHRLGAVAQEHVPAAPALGGDADAGRAEVLKQPAEQGAARVTGSRW